MGTFVAKAKHVLRLPRRKEKDRNVSIIRERGKEREKMCQKEERTIRKSNRWQGWMVRSGQWSGQNEKNKDKDKDGKTKRCRTTLSVVLRMYQR